MEVLFIALVFFPMFCAFAVYFADRKQNGNLRDLFAMATGVIVFVLMLILMINGMGSELYIPKICGMGLHFSLDGFRGVYGLIAAFMWMMTLLFSKEYLGHSHHLGRYYFFQLITLGATLGVFLSADLFTTFIFFEIMSFTSYVWVVQEETKGAIRAAETYLAVAVIGGMVLLMGLFLLKYTLGTLEMSALLDAAKACTNKEILYVAGCCTLVGFGAKAGAFPLHIWLPKAHPVAPAPASALLSGVLTKAGIFGVLVVSSNIFLHDAKWGLLLLTIGLFTMFGGALLAVFSVDLKRTLACSSMSQIGFILIGISMQGILGEHNALAIRGTLLHMVNHSLIKLVLFMIAGVVVMNIHKLDLNEIRGFGRKKPFLKLCFLSGALGISGIPLFNGYVSKTLLHESIVEGIAHYAEHEAAIAGFLQVSEWIFLFSGGMTFAYMLKLFIATFVEENVDAAQQQRFDSMKQYMQPLSVFAIGVSAVILPILGVVPNLVSDRIADLGHSFMHLEGEVHVVSYFSFVNLKGGLISIMIGIILYMGIRKFTMAKENGVTVYKNCWPSWLDLEELIYRPLLVKVLPCIAHIMDVILDGLMRGVTVLPFIARIVCRVLDSFVDGFIILLRKTIYKDSKIPHELTEGSEFTHLLGFVLDWVCSVKRRILHQPIPEHDISYEHKLAMQREKIMETNTIISRSLSFGLLLFYVGLVCTLIYLLYLGGRG